MKEIDTETSVVWPTWCYSDEVNCNVLKKCSKIEKDFDVNTDRESNNNIISIRKIQSRTNCNKKPAPLSTLDQLSLPTTSIVGENKMLSERSLLLSGYINSNTINSAKRNCDISNTSLAEVPLSGQRTGVTITPTTTAAAAAAYLYLEKVKNEQMSPRVTAAQLDSFKDAIMESSAAVAVAAAMVNNNNSISINNNNSNNNNNNNNKTNHNNSNNNSSGSASNCSNNISSINNLVNSQVQNQIINNSINNTSTSDELHSHSLTQSCNQTLQQEQQQQQQHQLQKQTHHHNHQQQQQHLSLHMNSNHVKKERLSPSTNGDLQTSLSRSRSTTPSSFRGTSPQNSVHSSPSDTLGPMHNLSTNLLNSIHQAAASNRHSNLGVSSSSVNSASSGLPTDFSTRNYSDFMRSLAAKYNNTNPNDNFKRNTLFEATSNNATAQKKITTAAQKTSYVTSPSTSLNKEITITTTSSLPPPIPLTTVPISPGESAIKLSQQNKLAAAVAACSNNVSPYMTSFLSSLPFSPGIFPHLIDMSSTQALITLARAAKENEIHNILSAPSQNQKRSAAGASPSPSPSLNMALQQAAQFISPALIYSAQLQKQQLQQQQNHQQQSQVSRQSSPRLTNISNSASPSTTSAKSTRNLGEKVNVSPLDLSSQPPPAKRFKAESTSSQSSTDCVMHTTITRRASSSTATTSPSPPPLTEKSLNASAIAVPTATVTDSVVVGSSSKTEATTTAFTPIKVASPTSATSSIASAVTVRQCQAQSEELNSWTVDDVCAFVGSIDICAVYVKHFRDQCIDGSGLPLLTEDHLVNSLGMKLGPALKLRSVLAKKLGGPCPCVSCVAQVQQVLALQNSGLTAAAITTTSTNATNISTIGSYTKSSGSCNSHFAQHSSATCNSSSSMSCSSYNSGINISSVNKNESTTATTTTAASSTRSLTTNVCNSDGSTSNTPRSNSSPNTNVDHFSSPPPLPPPAPSTTILQQQQQQHLHQKQQQHQQPSLATSDNADSSS